MVARSPPEPTARSVLAKSLDDILQIKDSLEPDYQVRHAALKMLRNYWWGKYWDQAQTESRTVSSIFKDLKGSQSDVGPDIKLVHNIVQQICVKYQSFLSPLPQIHVYTDPPSTETRKAQALRKQRYLYGCWAAGRMDRRFNNMAWYLPLMGSCYLGIHPDFERKLPLPLVRSAEYAYPIPGYNGEEDGVIFCWKVPESSVIRAYPNYVPQGDKKGHFSLGFRRGQSSDPLVEMIEYSDNDEFSRFVGEQRLAGVEHKYGFNLWEHFKFIDVPDEAFGHGAVEQVIDLNEAENILYSLLMQSVIDNVFPKLVLEDPSKAPEEIPSGPAAVLGLNPGGKAYYLSPPVQAIGMQTAFMQNNAQHIKESAGLSDPNFGQSPVASRVSGSAIDELLGSGSGTTIEMVQGTFGSGIANWNEKAIYIGQELFKDDRINVYGTEVHPMAINPRRFADSFKGSQLVGSSHNEVMFSPALNQHEKLVMWLQAKGGGLVSNQYIRNQIGIPDSAAMDEEIFSEAIEQGVLGAIVAELQAQPDAANAEKVENEGYAFLQGQTNPAAIAAGSTPPALAPPQAAAPPPPGQAGATAAAAGAPPAPSPESAAPAANTPPQAPQGPQGDQTITLDAAVAAFQQVTVTGRVFLVGEIVQRGQTDGDIEVALTKQEDQDALNQGLPQYAGRLVFHLVASEPSEPHMEVTQGAPAQRGGAASPNPEALRGVFVG
jgi:hypothetical protein